MSESSELGLSGLLGDENELFERVQPLLEYIHADNSPEYISNTNFGPTKLEACPAPPIQTQIPRVLSNEEYSGPLNFEVILDPCGSKNPWVYSSALKKIFIGMNMLFPVDFKWDLTTKESLFVRATPIFALPQYSQELVLRCINHTQKTDVTNKDLPPRIWDHVIRCQNSNAMYVGDKDQGQHLSVVVPLCNPQTGTDCVREMYQFMCKNSCPSGMNRKPLEVLFTLENEQATILGRRVLQVRICSCPKRDKDKEEKEHKDKKDNPQSSKKRKVEKKMPSFLDSPLDTKEYTLNLKIIGKHNYMSALRYCHDRMAAEILQHGPGADQAFRRCISEINNLYKSIQDVP